MLTELEQFRSKTFGIIPAECILLPAMLPHTNSHAMHYS